MNRYFTRVFTTEVGEAPGAYVERVQYRKTFA
jgi:AraC-like DNA-binding protein